MKRRVFLKVSAAGVSYAAMGPVMGLVPTDTAGIATFDAADAVWEHAFAGFPIKVRPVGPGGPLTPWIDTVNNAKKLVLADMPPCQITGIEVSVEFPDLADFKVEKLIHMPATFYNGEKQNVTLVWDQRGIIDPIIDV